MVNRFRVVSLSMLAAVVLAGCGINSPVPTPTAEPTSHLPTPADPLPLDQVARFSAVAVMNAGSNCTGTLVDTGVADGPAYVLTNGHCAGGVGLPAQKTELEREWSGTATFGAAAGNEENTLTVDVVGLAYSTMRHTDTAILRLKPSLAELRALGLRPIPITEVEPAEGTAVVNIGAPVQDLPEDEWVLRRGECTLGSQHTLIEFLWLWFGAWSNDCPGIIQGSSGSPLLSLDASGNPTAVVAMINTTTAGADPGRGGACFLNRPCEVTAESVAMAADTSYAQSVAGLGGCFTAAGEFALQAGCPLPTSDVWAEAGGGSFRGGGDGDAFDQLPRASLVGRTAGTVRTALVPIGDATGCQDPATYQAATAISVPAAGYSWEQIGTDVPVDLPADEGHYLLCAALGDDYAGAAGVLFEVDRTVPVLAAGAEVTDTGEAMIVQPHLDPPELATVRFTWGAPDEVDCEDTATFQDFFIIPLVVNLEDLPASYCVYGLDSAGNRTPVTRIELP